MVILHIGYNYIAIGFRNKHVLFELRNVTDVAVLLFSEDFGL